MKRENIERAAFIGDMLDNIDQILTHAQAVKFDLFIENNIKITVGYAIQDSFLKDLNSQVLDFIKEYLRNKKQKAEQELASL